MVPWLYDDIKALREGRPESDEVREGIANRLHRMRREVGKKYPRMTEEEIEQRAVQSVRSSLKNYAPDYGNAIKEVEYIKSLSPKKPPEK